MNYKYKTSLSSRPDPPVGGAVERSIHVMGYKKGLWMMDVE